MSSKFRSEHLAGQTLTSAEVQAEGHNCLPGNSVPLDSNSPMDPMTGTIPITLGEYPKGFWGLGKGLMTIAHVFPLIIAAEQRIPSVTKDLNHLPPTYEGCFHCLHGKCLRIWWVYRFWLKEARQKVSKNT